jgi:hypothetical protein
MDTDPADTTAFHADFRLLSFAFCLLSLPIKHP